MRSTHPHAWGMASFIVVALSTTAAVAQEVYFDIPRQPLTRAVVAFGHQTGMPVAVDANVARAFLSHAVVGRMLPDQALSMMLEGTNLAPVRENGVVVLRARPLPDRHAEADPRIENVIVTSERRSQNVQKISSSISVISKEVLENRNINNIFDLQYATPSLQIQPSYGSGQYTYFIRGVGFDGYSSNNSPTVGIYLDEVANPITFGINGMMFDMSRVEVLRGPQGTLYGRNTTGGAINYITNKPTDTFTAGIAGQYGRFDSGKVDGYISGPITQNLSFRLSGETQQGGAWQYNPVNGEHLGAVHRGAARLLVDYHPLDNLKFEFNLHGGRDRSEATGVHAWMPITTLGASSVLPYSSNRYTTIWGTSDTFAREIGISPQQKPFSNIDTGGVNLRTEYRMRGVTMTNIVSYDYMQRDEYDNFDYSTLALADVAFKTRASVESEELRFASNDNGRLRWLAGLYYGHEWLNDRYQSGFTDLYGMDGDVRYSQLVNTGSGFGQMTYNLTKTLRLIGGVRVEHEVRSLNNLYAHYIKGGAITNPANYVGQQSLSYTQPSARFSVEWDAAPRDMAYFTFARGIKSGGFTVYNTSNANVMTNPFKPENLYSFEVGNKFLSPRYHVRVNVDFFYYDYFNRQVQSQVIDPTSGGAIGIYVNAPKSHEYGGEYEIEWSPLPNLRITQSGAYATGAYDNFSAVTGEKKVNGLYVGVVTNEAGRALNIPHFTANGSVDYEHHIGQYKLNVGLDYSLRTTLHSLVANNTLAGYTLWGGYVALSPKKGHWKVEALGRNIFDKQYDVTRGHFVGGDWIGVAGMPATWEVRLSANF